MAFRIVKINSRCKLETRLNYLVCMKDAETKILLDEISILIVESQQVCVTTALISELLNHNIRVIFCDSKHNPSGEIQPYAGSKDSYKKIKKQIEWSQEIKDKVWKGIVQQKIHNQAGLLRKRGKDSSFLDTYEQEVQEGDKENREGLAAKVYFPMLFGPTFDRRDFSCEENVYLDYGYSIILSAVNREIAALGYLPQFGIHHIGESNPFNFGCDLMEPLRPFVDAKALEPDFKKEEFKSQMLDVLSTMVRCGERKMLLDNAIHDFVCSAINAINEERPELLLNVTFADEHL